MNTAGLPQVLWADHVRIGALSHGQEQTSTASEPRCRICGGAVEPHCFICDAEPCQLQALAEQAMLGGTLAHPPVRPFARRSSAARRVRFLAAPTAAYPYSGTPLDSAARLMP